MATGRSDARGFVFFTLLFVMICFRCAAAHAATETRTPETVPAYLEGVGLDEHLGASVPMDLVFTDEQGHGVHLRDAFAQGRPVLLTLNYSHCPMLCSLELSGLVKGLRQIDLKPGKDFTLVTVSLDPDETQADAARMKARYVGEYGAQSAASDWRFFRGTEENVRTLAASVGFRYRYDRTTKQYYHAAAMAVLTPSGRISRYLYGIAAVPETLRLGIVEASHGTVGSVVDRLILFCCAYDPKKGSYAFVATRVLRIGAGAVASALALGLGLLWASEIRNRKDSGAR